MGGCLENDVGLLLWKMLWSREGRDFCSIKTTLQSGVVPLLAHATTTLCPALSEAERYVSIAKPCLANGIVERKDSASTIRLVIRACRDMSEPMQSFGGTLYQAMA